MEGNDSIRRLGAVRHEGWTGWAPSILVIFQRAPSLCQTDVLHFIVIAVNVLDACPRLIGIGAVGHGDGHALHGRILR